MVYSMCACDITRTIGDVWGARIVPNKPCSDDSTHIYYRYLSVIGVDFVA